MDELYSVIDADGSQRHEVREAQLRADFQAGRIQGETLVWRPGLEQWAALKDLLPVGTWAAPAPRIELALDPHPEPAPKSEPAIRLEPEPARPVPQAEPRPTAASPRVSYPNTGARPFPRAEEAPASSGQRLWGLRVAGAMLLLDGLLSLFTGSLDPNQPQRVVLVVVNILLSLPLLLGMDRYRTKVLGACCVGLLVVPLLTLFQSGLPALGFMIGNTIFCGVLILLLAGEYLGLARFIVGSALAGCYFLMVGLGLAVGGWLHGSLKYRSVPSCHIEIMAYRDFQAQPSRFSTSEARQHFEEAMHAQSISTEVTETIYYSKEKDHRFDLEHLTQSLLQHQVGDRVGGSEAVPVPSPVDHGVLHGCQTEVEIPGYRACAFGFQDGPKSWVVILEVPGKGEGSAKTLQQILDSIHTQDN